MLIAYLSQALRVTVRGIQAYLATLHQVRLSVGEITGLLQRMSRQVKPAVDALRQAAQGQAVLHADETAGGRTVGTAMSSVWRPTERRRFVTMSLTGDRPRRLVAQLT